jgi:hypothetical protein
MVSPPFRLSLLFLEKEGRNISDANSINNKRDVPPTTRKFERTTADGDVAKTTTEKEIHN